MKKPIPVAPLPAWRPGIGDCEHRGGFQEDPNLLESRFSQIANPARDAPKRNAFPPSTPPGPVYASFMPTLAARQTRE
jgi:hypothetical protein